MRTAFATLCTILLHALPGPALSSDIEAVFPQQMTAKKLMTLCASSSLTAKGRARRRYCDGFVSGIEEGMRLYAFRYPAESKVAVCVAEGTSARVLSEAFIQHASAKGVDLEQPAAAVVLSALQKRFAC
jgi:hypothetical protein